MQLSPFSLFPVFAESCWIQLHFPRERHSRTETCLHPPVALLEATSDQQSLADPWAAADQAREERNPVWVFLRANDKWKEAAAKLWRTGMDFPWEPVAKCSVTASPSSQGFNPAGVLPSSSTFYLPKTQHRKAKSQGPGALQTLEPSPALFPFPPCCFFNGRKKGMVLSHGFMDHLSPGLVTHPRFWGSASKVSTCGGSWWSLCHTGKWGGHRISTPACIPHPRTAAAPPEGPPSPCQPGVLKG